jgi:hypothetical protein
MALQGFGNLENKNYVFGLLHIRLIGIRKQKEPGLWTNTNGSECSVGGDPPMFNERE